MLNRRDVAVVVFTLLYLAASVPVALGQGNQEFVFYIGVVVLLAAGVGWLHLRIGLHPASLWCLSLWGFLHMAGGLVRVGETGVLYNLWLLPEQLKFDQAVHAFGFFSATWVCWQGMCRRLADPRPTWGLMILAAAAGMGLGALNEVVEFTATLLVPETNVGGYVNTGWDLVSNLVGATVAVVLIRRGVLPGGGWASSAGAPAGSGSRPDAAPAPPPG